MMGAKSWFGNKVEEILNGYSGGSQSPSQKARQPVRAKTGIGRAVESVLTGGGEKYGPPVPRDYGPPVPNLGQRAEQTLKQMNRQSPAEFAEFADKALKAIPVKTPEQNLSDSIQKSQEYFNQHGGSQGGSTMPIRESSSVTPLALPNAPALNQASHSTIQVADPIAIPSVNNVTLPNSVRDPVIMPGIDPINIPKESWAASAWNYEQALAEAAKTRAYNHRLNQEQMMNQLALQRMQMDAIAQLDNDPAVIMAQMASTKKLIEEAQGRAYQRQLSTDAALNALPGLIASLRI